MRGVVTLCGMGGSAAALWIWGRKGFSALDPEEMMRLAIPAAAALEIGSMLVFSGFFIGIIKTGSRAQDRGRRENADGNYT